MDLPSFTNIEAMAAFLKANPEWAPTLDRDGEVVGLFAELAGRGIPPWDYMEGKSYSTDKEIWIDGRKFECDS